MSRNFYIVVFIINIVVELSIIFVLLFYKLYIYILFFIVLLFITINVFINYCKSSSSEELSYLNYLNHIKKSFYSILVRINSLLDITDKNLINVYDLEDLLDMQLKLKNPILYYEEEKSCTFFLVSGNDIYSSVLRMNDDISASIDKLYQNINISNFRKIATTKEHDNQIDLPKLKS